MFGVSVAVAILAASLILLETPATKQIPGARSITTNAELDAALASGAPVLVELSATWCDACRRLAPTLARVAQAHQGVQLLLVDVDEAPELASRLQASRIPALRFFHGRQAIASRTGLLSEAALEKLMRCSEDKLATRC